MRAGKLRAAGEHPVLKNAAYDGPMPRSHRTGDPPLKGANNKPCARCRRPFQPTIRRRLLCGHCFSLGAGFED